MDALRIQPAEGDGAAMEEGENGGGQEVEGKEASSPTGSTTDEETDDDSEPEPPPVVRRKVSFADAFGLNLVSVKEFDNVEATESEVNPSPESEAACPLEEFYMSCLFTVPSSPEELDQRLQVQNVELESIELLPGTTTLRGTIRVVNLCFSKSVYARISLDCWDTYFDLLAEYVPGSSDRKTDRFSFKYPLIPPVTREGTRVDFCLRYETAVGTFWANNKQMNYVLFCHQKGQVKEPAGPQVPEENTSYRSKRSCLRANRRGSTEEKAKESNNTASFSTEAQEADRKTVDGAEMQPLLHHEGHSLLVDGEKSWHRATCLAREQDGQIPRAYSHDSATGQKGSQLTAAPWCDSASSPYDRQKKPSEGRQVPTYHQIPLLTLDWRSDQQQHSGAADMEDVWARSTKPTRPKSSKEKIDDTPSVNDLWETFLNGTDDSSVEETSVCDVWQKFLEEPRCKDHSGVPESEWLQTATSVSPSNHRETRSRYLASSQVLGELQVSSSAPPTSQAHTSDGRQLQSDKSGTSWSRGTSSAGDHLPAEACVDRPGDDNTATSDASQRSETNSVTDTLQEFRLEGATPVSGGSVDSSAECHQHAVWEREGGGIIGEAGGDEPVTLHTTDLVTSAGESKTTDTTEMPGSQNASTGDMISQGAGLDKGLSSSGDGEVAGTAHNAVHDTLAFRETIKEGTKDGERFVFSPRRQRAEEKITTNCMENEVSTEEEIFRPHKTEDCEISQRYADGKHHEESRLNRKSENPLLVNVRAENEIRPAQSHARGFSPTPTWEENIRPGVIMESEIELDDSENKNMASGNKDVEEYRQTQVETFHKHSKRISEGPEMTLLDEKVSRHHEKPFQLYTSVWHNHNQHSMGSPTVCVQQEEENSTMTQEEKNVPKREHVFVSYQTNERQSLGCGAMNAEAEEIKPSSQSTRSGEMRRIKACDTFRIDECVPNAAEDGEVRLVWSQEGLKGQRESVGSGRSPEEVIAKENAARQDTPTELQHGPETIERLEEKGRMSIGQLKAEVEGKLMGNVEDPRGSAEDENSPCVDSRKLSEATNDSIEAETASVERFGEDLVRRVWEELFSQTVRDTNLVDEMSGVRADVPDVTYDGHRPFEKRDHVGICTSKEPTLTYSPGLEHSTVRISRENAIKEMSQSHFPSELQADLSSSAYLGRDLTTLAALRMQSLAESGQTTSSPKDQENFPQLQSRPVARQESGEHTEDSSFEKLKGSDNVLWWGVYILAHIARLVTCGLLVAGFFFVGFLCDFPAFFAVYMISLCWWFYKWKRHQVALDSGEGQEFTGETASVKE